MNFQGCVYCLILNYQGSLLAVWNSLAIISSSFYLVNNFFKLFLSFSELFIALLEQLRQFIMSFLSCQEYFYTLYSLNKKRRRRDLNPRAGCPTYTLSRGASSASWVLLLICFCNALTLYKNIPLLVNYFFNIFKAFPFFSLYIVEVLYTLCLLIL